MTNKRTISGPGAADFLTSGGGEDLPGSSTSSKGTGNTREDSSLTDPRNLVPNLGPDSEAEPGERETAAKPRREDELTGSQTGTVGGGGPDAHNPDAGLGGRR
jgi:hypothetical protein